MPKHYLIFALCLAFSTASSVADSWHFIDNDVKALHHKTSDIRRNYGPASQQVGELRLPKTKGPYPVIIIIHGGCWLSSFASAANTQALAEALSYQGYATWNIEYRSVNDTGGGWPGTFEDIGKAADYLRQLEKGYSLDLSKVIVLGHSAGGHLALWLAGRHTLTKSSRLYSKNPLVLKGVIALGGVPDLRSSRNYAEKVCNVDAIGKLLGSKEAENHYKEGSPIDLLPIRIKQILIYGEDDTVVPISAGQAYVEKAKKLGDSVTLMTVKYAAHHEYIVPNSVTWPLLLKSIKSLMSSHQD